MNYKAVAETVLATPRLSEVRVIMNILFNTVEDCKNGSQFMAKKRAEDFILMSYILFFRPTLLQCQTQTITLGFVQPGISLNPHFPSLLICGIS